MSQLLNHRYQVIRRLGSGGFGETFLAEDTQMPSHRRCVIKQLRPINHNPQVYQLVQERFQREAALLEKLGNANSQIPSLYAYFDTAGKFYLVQEWIEGTTLSQLLEQQGKLPPARVEELLQDILPVLQFLHSQGIVHRDIKPDNIIVRAKDNLPVLIDFGAVRETMGTVVQAQDKGTRSIIVGTPGFMPSEQAAGRPVFNSDLYSLGLTAIYLLTGKIPQDFPSDPHTGEIQWQREVSDANSVLVQVLTKAVQSHPQDRFSSATEMLSALSQVDQVPGKLPTTVLPQTQPIESPPAQLSSSLKGIVTGSIIVGGIVGGAVLAGMWMMQPPTPEIREEVANSAISPATESESPPTPPSSNSQLAPPVVTENQDFYFVTDSAYADVASANSQVSALQSAGYGSAGVFWIPDYPNLSGEALFQVYAGKFRDRGSCANFIQTYGQTNPDSYCVFGSSNPQANPDRFQMGTSPSVIEPQYSWLSSRQVTPGDLGGKSAWELSVMRNSIYARKGRRFNTPELQQYFDSQSWYTPRYTPDQFPNSLLSDLESRNASYILDYQNRNGLRAF